MQKLNRFRCVGIFFLFCFLFDIFHAFYLPFTKKQSHEYLIMDWNEMRNKFGKKKHYSLVFPENLTIFCLLVSTLLIYCLALRHMELLGFFLDSLCTHCTIPNMPYPRQNTLQMVE